jgi:hypothetical protein
MMVARARGDPAAPPLDRRQGREDVVLRRSDGDAALTYAGVAGGAFRFAPTLAVLLADPRVERAVDRQRVLDYLRGGRGGDAEATLLRGVRRLPADPAFRFEGNAAVPGGRLEAAVVPAEGSSGADDLPTSAAVLAELPEAVRAHEEPFACAADYLRWRGTVTDRQPEELLGRWLRTRRAQVQGIFRSPGFCDRPFWDGLAVSDRFRRACSRPATSMVPFWRALNLELWLRCFVDRPRPRLRLPMTGAEATALGDRTVGTAPPGAVAHAGRHLAMVGRDRAPLPAHPRADPQRLAR